MELKASKSITVIQRSATIRYHSFAFSSQEPCPASPLACSALLERQQESRAKRMLQTTHEFTLNSTLPKSQQLPQSLKGLTCHIRSARREGENKNDCHHCYIDYQYYASLAHTPSSHITWRISAVPRIAGSEIKAELDVPLRLPWHFIGSNKIQAIHKYQFTNASPLEVYRAEFLALLKLVILHFFKNIHPG